MVEIDLAAEIMTVEIEYAHVEVFDVEEPTLEAYTVELSDGPHVEAPGCAAANGGRADVRGGDVENAEAAAVVSDSDEFMVMWAERCRPTGDRRARAHHPGDPGRRADPATVGVRRSHRPGRAGPCAVRRIRAADDRRERGGDLRTGGRTDGSRRRRVGRVGTRRHHRAPPRRVAADDANKRTSTLHRLIGGLRRKDR